jgi:hypothetical protein
MKITKTGTYGVNATGPGASKSDRPKKSSGVAEDQVEVSGEARSLFEAEQAKKLAEIEERVESGFYFSSTVTSKLVQVLRSLLMRKSPS